MNDIDRQKRFSDHAFQQKAIGWLGLAIFLVVGDVLAAGRDIPMTGLLLANLVMILGFGAAQRAQG